MRSLSPGLYGQCVDLCDFPADGSLASTQIAHWSLCLCLSCVVILSPAQATGLNHSSAEAYTAAGLREQLQFNSRRRNFGQAGTDLTVFPDDRRKAGKNNMSSTSIRIAVMGTALFLAAATTAEAAKGVKKVGQGVLDLLLH